MPPSRLLRCASRAVPLADSSSAASLAAAPRDSLQWVRAAPAPPCAPPPPSCRRRRADSESPPTAQQLPITTIPPFSDVAQLPDCAKQCGPLYDANGACVPPARPQADAPTYTSCFCAHGGVASFSQGAAGVCDNACSGVNGGLQSIAAWFQRICSATPGDNDAGPTTATTATAGESTAGAPGSSNSAAAGGDW